MARQSSRSDSARAPFAIEPPHDKKAQRGRTSIEDTQLTILTDHVNVPEALPAFVRKRLGEKLGKFSGQMQRVTVRFNDINGPKGGVDIECRIQVSLHPLSTLVVKGLGTSARNAFDATSSLAARAVQRALDRAGFSEGRARKRAPKTGREQVDSPSSTDSRTERSAGGRTATRNARKHAPKATAMLEDSATGKPSRKSSRKSANRAKAAQNLERAAHDSAMSSKSRAAAEKVHRR